MRITLRPAADWSRFWMNLSAVLQVTGGSIAVVAAYGVEGATFGLATPAAIALGFWGADQTYAGMKTLVNQTPSTTALGEIFELAGVSPDYSEMVAGLLPIGPSALKGAVSLGLKSSALRSIDVQVVKKGGQVVIDRLSFIATKTRERFTFRRIANKKSENVFDAHGADGARETLRQTGARTFELSVDDYMKLEGEAIEFYEKIRLSDNMDVLKISSNTGWPEYRIQRIKNHVFVDDTHILTDGKIKRFDPDHRTVEAWKRLQSNNYKISDIDLLKHEYFESKFEKLFRTDYMTAHKKTLLSGRTWKPEF